MAATCTGIRCAGELCSLAVSAADVLRLGRWEYECVVVVVSRARREVVGMYDERTKGWYCCVVLFLGTPIRSRPFLYDRAHVHASSIQPAAAYSRQPRLGMSLLVPSDAEIELKQSTLQNMCR